MPESVVKVVLFGTGRSGTEITRVLLERHDLRLVGGVVTDPRKEGMDLGELTIGQHSGIPVTTDFDAVLADRPDLVLHTGLGTNRDVADLAGRAVDAGVDFITVNGLIAPVFALGEKAAKELHYRAVEGRSRILGTGVNPGFLLDTLPVVWGSMVSGIRKVYARRVSEIKNWGVGVLRDEIGIGGDPSVGPPTDALSVDNSAALIDQALALSVDRLDNVNERVPSPNVREVDDWKIMPGDTVGFRHRCIGYRGRDTVLEVEWLGILGLDPTIDGAEDSAVVKISGDSEVEASCGGTLLGDPYPSTAARAINAIRPLAGKPPGLYRPDQVPVNQDRGFR